MNDSSSALRLIASEVLPRGDVSELSFMSGGLRIAVCPEHIAREERFRSFDLVIVYTRSAIRWAAREDFDPMLRALARQVFLSIPQGEAFDYCLLARTRGDLSAAEARALAVAARIPMEIAEGAEELDRIMWCRALSVAVVMGFRMRSLSESLC